MNGRITCLLEVITPIEETFKEVKLKKAKHQKQVSINVDHEELQILNIFCEALIKTFNRHNNSKGAVNVIKNARKCKGIIHYLYNVKFNVKGFDFTGHEIYFRITEREWIDKIKSHLIK